MASLSYDKIFNNFMGNMTDPNFASLSISEAYGLMTEYLHKTMAQSYVRRIFACATLDDKIQILDYELAYKTEDSADMDFVEYILARGMLVEWLQPQVQSRVNISQMIGGSKEKFYSQSSHLSELKGLLSDTKTELRKAIRDRGYIYNSYLKENK